MSSVQVPHLKLLITLDVIASLLRSNLMPSAPITRFPRVLIPERSPRAIAAVAGLMPMPVRKATSWAMNMLRRNADMAPRNDKEPERRCPHGLLHREIGGIRMSSLVRDPLTATRYIRTLLYGNSVRHLSLNPPVCSV